MIVHKFRHLTIKQRLRIESNNLELVFVFQPPALPLRPKKGSFSIFSPQNY